MGYEVMSKKHIMVDLETLGTTNKAVVVSVGAVEFDPATGQLGKQYYNTISVDDQVRVGMELTPSTVLWWMEQSDAARKALCAPDKPAISPRLFLTEFKQWWKSVSKNSYFWSHATFDAVILKNLYSAYMEGTPWGYRDCLDIRTIVALAPQKLKDELFAAPRAGLTPHNALDDAIYQAQYVSRIWQEINGGCGECKKESS